MDPLSPVKQNHKKLFSLIGTGGRTATTLGNELGSSLRDVGFSLRCLDVFEEPARVRFADELKAQDPVLGEVHVLGEDRHVFVTLVGVGEVGGIS